jgi:hypothetical protein
MPASVPPLESHPLAHAALSGASVLYTDLDGTLLGPGARLLSDATGEPWLGVAEAVVALNRAGLTCVICSGRNRWQLMEVSRLLGWDSYIAELGCVIVPGSGERRSTTPARGVPTRCSRVRPRTRPSPASDRSTRSPVSSRA